MPEELPASRLSESAPASRRPGGTGAQPERLTDDIVKQVADKVYAMLMQDLVIERERQRPSSRVMGSRGGW